MDTGERPLLVFAHSFGGSARSWAPLLVALGGTFECIAPNLPGFGGTPGLKEGPSLEGYIDRFAALAEDRPWIAVGHSMGGKIALGAAARSKTIAGLILIAPSPPTPEPMSEDERQEALTDFGERAAAERRVRNNSNNNLAPDMFREAVDDQLRVDHDAWRWWLELGSRQDISNQMALITAPTVVLYGDADGVLGTKLPVSVAAGLGDARAIAIPGAGHLVSMERPVAVAGAIGEFVETILAM